MNQTLLLIFCLVLFCIELLYFRLATQFNIVDKPNHRSSHNMVTIRGGGIIFALSVLLQPLFFKFGYPYFLSGLLIVTFISFMDDLSPVSNKLRLLVHLVCVGLMFYEAELFQLPIYWLILALFFVIGTINAINFMDGINGITGVYSLVLLLTLFYINYIEHFIVQELLIVVIISLLVFLFFNFRTKAKCFAGDAGSVGIAFIIAFLLLKLVIKTENLNYILLLLVYGLDTTTTIIFRIIRKERVFEPHRSHFYQFWANERKGSHLIISSLYALVQLAINALVIRFLPPSFFGLCIALFSSALIFLVIRFSTEGYVKLLGE